MYLHVQMWRVAQQHGEAARAAVGIIKAPHAQHACSVFDVGPYLQGHLFITLRLGPRRGRRQGVSAQERWTEVHT
jgi:hypothetical protein